MANGITKTKVKQRPADILPTSRRRLMIWEMAQGLWRNRRPDPMQELRKMRREWNRRQPRLKK